MDIRPRKASPILKRNTNPKIHKAIFNPFCLKKVSKGPPILLLIQAAILLPQYLSAFNNAFNSVNQSDYIHFI